MDAEIVPPLPLERPAQPTAGPALNRARIWLALAGLLAGLAAFGAGEAVYKLVPAEKVKQTIMGQTLYAPTGPTTIVADTRNAALAFGILGVCLGGFLGAAGGLARRSAIATLGAGLLGALLALAIAVLGSFAMLPFIMDVQPYHPEYELLLSIAAHAALWGLPGAAAGLAFGVGLGHRGSILRGVAGGFAGAVLGTVVFDVIGAAIFPLAGTAEPISATWPSRLFARLAVTLGCAALAIVSLPGEKPVASRQVSEVLIEPSA